MLKILTENGYEAKYGLVTPTHLVSLHKIIKAEEDAEKKKSYRQIFWANILIGPAYMIFMIIGLECFR